MKKGFALVILFIGLLGFVSQSHAQTRRLSEANKLYNKMAYYFAAEAYEDVLARGVDSLQIASNIADCYDKIENNAKAAAWYELIERRSILNSRQLFRYAMVLRQLQKYDLSLQKFMEYEARYGATELTRKKIAEHYLLERFALNDGSFEISNQSIVNTQASDIGIAFYDHGRVFISNAARTNYLTNRTYSRMGNKFYNLYIAKVDELGAISAPKRIKGNSKFHDGPAIYCPVNKVIYFTRSNYVGGKKNYDQNDIMRLKLFRAEINAKGKVVNESELAINSDFFSTGHPAISADGKTLFFASDRPGGFGGTDIWKVTIDSNGNTGNPINLGFTVNTSQNEMFPFVEGTSNMLFFASDGHTGLGGLDVFYGFMNESQNMITGLTNLGMPINSQYDDFGFLIDGNLEKGYFVSNRAGGIGDDDVYGFRMLKPFVPMLSAQGLISACSNKSNMLHGASVVLRDSKGKEISRTVVGEDGYYRFILDPAVKDEYFVEASISGFESETIRFSTDKLSEGIHLIENTICLKEADNDFDPLPELALKVIVLDKSTREIIQGARVLVVDEVTNRQVLSETTTSSGEIVKTLKNKRLLDDLIFRVRADKSGYRGKIVDYASIYETPGLITVVLELEKGDIPADGQEIIACNGKKYVLSPIYFDLDKSDIRPDAARELDKIIELLTACPDMKMEIGSHTDCRHNYAYNDALSNRRAQATLNYIKARIPNPSRLSAVGYGERKLAVDCPCEPSNESSCSEDLHQLNRRTEFKVLSVGTTKVQNSTTVSNGQSRADNTYGGSSDSSTLHGKGVTSMHIVQENETLYRIAQMYGLSVEKIMQLNGLKSDLILPGQRLKLA